MFWMRLRGHGHGAVRPAGVLVMRSCEVKRALRRELNVAGTLAALLCGRAVICVSKTTARALVRDALMRSAYLGRAGTVPVTVLRPQPAALAVQPIPAGTDLSWASPGGWMGTLPEAGG